MELIPNMSKLAYIRPYPCHVESSRTIGILNFCIENQAPGQKLCGKNIPYIEIGPNEPIPGHFWMSGGLESSILKNHVTNILNLIFANLGSVTKIKFN